MKEDKEPLWTLKAWQLNADAFVLEYWAKGVNLRVTGSKSWIDYIRKALMGR